MRFCVSWFESGGIVRRPRPTLSNEAGATTGSVFNSNERTGFAPLPCLAQFPQWEQLAAGPAFAADFRQPFIGSGAHPGNGCGNHAAIGKANESLAGRGVLADFVRLDLHCRGHDGAGFRNRQRKSLKIFFRGCETGKPRFYWCFDRTRHVLPHATRLQG